MAWSFRLMLVVVVVLLRSALAHAEPAGDLAACRQQASQHVLHCYEAGLEAIIKTEGTERALAALERLTQEDPLALSEAHPLVHHIGKRSFVHYGDASGAMAHCTAQFWSGCYHGVLQAYLSSLPKIEATHVRGLCPTTDTAPAYSFQRYNCLHGLGHGMTMQFRYDLLKSLAYCDVLTASWDRESCYGGVFMENIVAFQESQRSTAAHQHDHRQSGSFLNPEDPLYPCSVLHEKYLQACYLMQTSAVLTLVGYDFAQAFGYCHRAPTQYQVTCARSLGRDISGFTLRNADRVKELCALGQGTQVQQCVIGAVKDFMLTVADPEPGLALCRAVDGAYKQGCYVAVGEVMLNLSADVGQRQAVCRRAEDDYTQACLAVVGAS